MPDTVKIIQLFNYAQMYDDEYPSMTQKTVPRSHGGSTYPSVSASSISLPLVTVFYCTQYIRNNSVVYHFILKNRFDSSFYLFEIQLVFD